jgi:hypothetical protein
MSVVEVLTSLYHWADAHAGIFLAASLALPALGTLLAWLGKLGRSDRDGRWLASALIGVAIGAVVLEALALLVARYAVGASLLEADAALLAAPVVCLSASIAGIRLLFPIGQLASVRSAADVGLFLLAGVAALWLLSKFRGWGFVFLGWTGDFFVIVALAAVLLRRLHRRAFGARPAVAEAVTAR